MNIHMRKIVSLFTVLVMLLSSSALAQNRSVSGVVRDDKGAPVPFATINETGTRNATKADENGTFKISIRENSTLTISSTGFTSVTLRPTDGVQNISLTSANANLQEVVVTTALGIKRQAREVGYSTATISGQEL